MASRASQRILLAVVFLFCCVGAAFAGTGSIREAEQETTPVESYFPDSNDDVDYETAFGELHLRYFAFHFFMRQMQKGRVVEFEMLDNTGQIRKFKLASDLGTRYLPRLPVPINGIRDSANVSWKMLDDNIGYIYVRRIRPDLEAALDKAISELNEARGLIVDVRGNTCSR